MSAEQQDKNAVRVKGMGDGLCVMLDPDRPPDVLEEELTRVFTPLRHLAVNARVMLDFGDGEGGDALVGKLGDFLRDSFGVGEVARIARRGKNGPDERLRQRDMDQSWHHYRSDVLMLTGRVRSGQKVTARRHLLILGDVNPGAEVAAGGDIIIMGSLAGTAAAGQTDDLESIVLALDFRPTQVQIGPVMAAGLPASPRPFPEYAHVEEGGIVVEDYIRANPFGRLPWPEVR